MTAVPLTFIAYGRPAPKGSKHRGASGQMVEASRFLDAWMRELRLAAQRARIAANWATTSQPCELSAVFALERAADPAPGCELVPAKKPDLDKLLRAVADALTQARVWDDDSLWTDTGLTRKRYAPYSWPADQLDPFPYPMTWATLKTPGAWVRVKILGDEDLREDTIT